MNINVMLQSRFEKYLNEENIFFKLKLEKGKTAFSLLEKLGIPLNNKAAIIVNGKHQKATTTLKDGDEVRLYLMHI